MIVGFLHDSPYFEPSEGCTNYIDKRLQLTVNLRQATGQAVSLAGVWPLLFFLLSPLTCAVLYVQWAALEGTIVPSTF